MHFRMLSAIFSLTRRVISPSSVRGVVVLNRVARLSTTPAVRFKDDDIKNDPEVKSFLKEINKDFGTKNKPEEKTDEQKPSTEGSTDSGTAGKNISQLLSELYGSEGEKRDTFSSVGELFCTCNNNLDFTVFFRWL